LEISNSLRKFSADWMEFFSPGAAPTSSRTAMVARHPIEIQPGGLLSQITDGSQREMVNSLHAQAIDKVADGLAVEAISDDGVIEAVSATRPNSFALGVQWHPEYPITKECVLSRRLFAAFNQATLRHLNARLSDTNKTQAA
jgi:gamma-glutamyl-gamma-aminobutyrate hydrolase PuuD